MNKETLNVLSVKTGTAGWPQKGDYLGRTRYRKKQWHRVQDSFSSKDQKGNTVQSIFIESWTELSSGWTSKTKLRKKFPYHVPVSMILDATANQKLEHKRKKEITA